MFEQLMENLKYVDDSTMQGIVFAAGIAFFYICKKIVDKTSK